MVYDMSRCPTCGQEAGEPTIALLRDAGFNPLEDCMFRALYGNSFSRCIGKDNPKVMRQCELCPVSKLYGRWEVNRGKQVFVPTEEEFPC